MNELEIKYKNKAGNLRVAYAHFIHMQREGKNWEYMDKKCKIHTPPIEFIEALEQAYNDYLWAQTEYTEFINMFKPELISQGILNKEDYE